MLTNAGPKWISEECASGSGPRQDSSPRGEKGRILQKLACGGVARVPAGFVIVADEANVTEGEVKAVFVLGHPVVLCMVRGRIYACSAECTHDEAADLAQGKLVGYHLTCPEHGCGFDVRSGRVIAPPAEEPLPTHEVKIEGGHVWVANRPRGF